MTFYGQNFELLESKRTKHAKMIFLSNQRFWSPLKKSEQILNLQYSTPIISNKSSYCIRWAPHFLFFVTIQGLLLSLLYNFIKPVFLWESSQRPSPNRPDLQNFPVVYQHRFISFQNGCCLLACKPVFTKPVSDNTINCWRC